MTLDERRTLFEELRALWPRTFRELSTDDYGVPLSEPSLNAVYWPMYDAMDPADEWKYIGAWAFHQALWETAQCRDAEGATEFSTDDVPFKLFAKKMKKILRNEEWSHLSW